MNKDLIEAVEKLKYQKIIKSDTDLAKLMEENKSITGVWYDFDDCDMQELREAAKKYDEKMEFAAYKKKMRLQINKGHSTIFCFSKEVRVKEHIVIEEAIENV